MPCRDGQHIRPLVLGIAGLLVRDVEFAAPMKLYRDDPRSVRIIARPQMDGDRVSVVCRLEAERMLPNADSPQVTTHFTATVVLDESGPEPRTAEVPDAPAHQVDADDIYQIYFHGPTYQVLGAAGGDADHCVGKLATDLPANHHPSDAPLTTEPRLVELGFQTAGVWEIGTTGVMALPTGIDVLRPIRHHDGQPVWAVARPREGGDGFDLTVVDADGNVYCELEGYRTVQLPAPVSDELRQPLAAAVG